MKGERKEHMSAIIKNVLHELKKDRVIVSDNRNTGRGFSIDSQPFELAKLYYDPAHKFMVKLDVSKPGSMKLSLEASAKLQAELKQITEIAIRLNLSINL